MTDLAQRALDVLSLMVLEDGKRWAQTAAPYQWKHARAILDPASEVRQTWIELPRGARKTTDLAGLMLAVLYTQAPPMSRLYVGASDEDQAAELIDAAHGLIARTSELEGVFLPGELEITCRHSGASLRALPADASAMGKRAWWIVLDEVCNWPDTRKGRRFWGVLMSGNRKLADCRTVVISNSGDPQHWSFKRRETARTSQHWRFFSLPGPLPWLTAADLEILRENAEVESEYERLHLNKWVTSEDRLASRADLAVCTTLPGPLPPRRGSGPYVATLDVGIVNDRTVLAVLHLENSESGRRVVLDRIVRWQGTRAAPVDLAEVRDTLLALTMDYYSAEVVLDPHQAVLIAQECRAKGVRVHEFAFTATSVGRLALSLHQAIRNHRVALPDDEALIDELASVRLRKNSLGIYRLDHDSGRHDDQAIALALGAYYLLDGGDSGAEQWIEWARKKALAVREVRALDGGSPAAPAAAAAQVTPRFTPAQSAKARALVAAGAVTPAAEPGAWRVRGSDGRTSYLVTADSCDCAAGSHGRPCKHRCAAIIAAGPAAAAAASPDGPLEGVVLDAVTARKLARDRAWREQAPLHGFGHFLSR